MDQESAGPPAGQEAQQTSAPEDPMLYCPVCNARLQERRCTLRCPRCGYYMSCSDYY